MVKVFWNYSIQLHFNPKLRDGIEVVPSTVREIAWKGPLQMCQQYPHLAAVGKPKVIVTTVVIAHEMLGFIWAIARTVTTAPA